MEFLKNYPHYLPGGIGEYVKQNWNDIFQIEIYLNLETYAFRFLNKMLYYVHNYVMFINNEHIKIMNRGCKND